MGTAMKPKDFGGVFKSPKGVLVRNFRTIGSCPLMGFALAKMKQFSPEIAGGKSFDRIPPVGWPPTLWTIWQKANLALFHYDYLNRYACSRPFVTPRCS